MTTKNRKASRKTGGKPSKKTPKRTKSRKVLRRPAPRPTTPKKVVPTTPATKGTQPLQAIPAREGTGFKITLGQIDQETVLGDLIVVFPKTREVLRKHGLRLDVDQAGDIYMTLQAFAALQGLKTESLIGELREVSKEPITPTVPPVPQLVAPATT